MSLLCFCGAYNGKPHQVGSGKCHGSSFAESYFLNEHAECSFCNCNKDSYCQVATGQEDIRECQVYEIWKNYGDYPEYFHPLPDNFLEKKMEREWKERYNF